MTLVSSSRKVLFFLSLAVGIVLSPTATNAQIAATEAFNSPGCSNVDLAGDEINVLDIGIRHVPSPYRSNPEWKAIILDPSKPANLQPPTILEGWVKPQPNDQTSGSQSTSEVAEEDLWWNHFTHDFTIKVIPDSAYSHLLDKWVNPDGTTGVDTDMEVEWDSASLMDEKEGFQRIWGAVPEFVWPTVGDRVWISGRWIFDCGHPGPNPQIPYVRFSTEIHPPRVLVAFRLNHPALDSFPKPRVSAPNFPAPQSYLPVTGEPVDPAALPSGVPNSGPTNVPLTEADIYVSGNGGATNDLCSIVGNPCPGHTGPIIPVNDRNYVFDVYPPGTCWGPAAFCNPPNNGTLAVHPPVPDASLQWRLVNHFSELPAHACGGVDNTVCVTVDPIICPVDSSTPPPNQSETACPAVPAHPTRLRVILPFAGSAANFFAQSILLGWDDVPTPANNTPGVRTFQVRLHKLTVKDNGAGCCNDADWRVFVNVGGQYRYISRVFDADDDGNSICNGADPLTENANNDCYQFDGTPWTVSVQDGTPIHVAVGGFVARGLEDNDSNVYLCRNYPGGCDTPTDFDPADKPFIDLGFDNDDRIGTYEFDLGGPDYAPPPAFTTAQLDCGVFSLTGCSIRYQVEFTVQEVPQAAAPTSAPLVIGTPNFVGSGNTYFTSATPMIPQTADPNVEGFQYRFHLQGADLPTYATSPFPIHWAHADLASGVHSVEVKVGAANAGDGLYDFQYSAESFGNLLEPRHTATFVLDNTAPVITIAQPAAATYGRGDTLTLNYTVSDGTGSGVKTVTAKLDGLTAAQFGASLDSGQKIYLFSMSLGSHTFSIDAVDNLGNASSKSVAFTIGVTPDSLKEDVTDLQTLGCIDNIGQALLAKISAAQDLITKGQMQAAINTLAALILQVQAQAGNHISTSCADPNGKTFDPVQLLLEDAHYLQLQIAGQLSANPILGWVVNSAGAGLNQVTVNLLNASSTVIATAATDATGFYYFAASGLTVGQSYTLRVAVPAGYTSSTPASQTFTWSAASVVGNFMLN